MTEFTGISHIDLSVSDAEVSAAWYCEVLGLRRIRRDDFETRSSILLKHDATGLFVGISQHSAQATARFDERGPGLDHIGFRVAERADLDAWQRRLDEHGVTYSPVAEDASGVGSALVFRDPDNIQLEFWWTRPH
jgi:catechol 2,3-dioxygenase-like lactoylglutathione lyase family enzyme